MARIFAWTAFSYLIFQCLYDRLQSVIVPVIDISALREETDQHQENYAAVVARKVEVANSISRACEEVGFFIIIGHGVKQEVIDEVWSATHEFFDLPEDEKLQYTRPQQEYPFGFTKLGGEVLSAGKNVELTNSSKHVHAPDLKEMFSIGPKNPAAGFPPRIFPSVPERFGPAWETYYEEINSLANSILSAFEIALNLPPNFFISYTDHHASAMRALNYPNLDGFPPVPGQLRASPHTDYGTITILRADGPGLQVSKDKDPPQWHDVPYVKDGFIINLGDLMKRWTNDRWLSTLHRVINPLTGESGICSEENESDDRMMSSDSCASLTRRRQSIAFFHNLNRDATVSVLDAENPKYEPIIAGDFLMQKHLAAMGDAISKA